MSFLMYHDTEVMKIRDNPTTYMPEASGEILNKNMLPYILQKDSSTDGFQKWLSLRKIPDNRDGLGSVIDEFGPNVFRDRRNDFYSSLEDGYWIRTREQKWRRINFFDNLFVPDTGAMFFAPWKVEPRRYRNQSPDMSTGGVCMKTWIKMNGVTSLIKAGHKEPDNGQTPLGEVLTSTLCEILGINCVHSEFYIHYGYLCSKTDLFVKSNEELVTADHIYEIEPEEKGEKPYEHLIRMCEKEHIPDAKRHIDENIFVDNMTGNDTRSLGDIGFIRDIEKNVFIRPAPIFDNGHAYWDTDLIKPPVKSKLFGDVELDVVNAIKKDFDLKKLDNTDEIMRGLRNYPDITKDKWDKINRETKNRNVRLSMDKLI